MQVTDERNLETIPVGPLGIIPLESCKELGDKVNSYLVAWRNEREHEHKSNIAFKGYQRDSYIIGGILLTEVGSLLAYGLIYLFMGGNFAYTASTMMGQMISTSYINMSIFLAFATLYPDMQVLLYFIIPIKMKWMAAVYVVIMVFSVWDTYHAIYAYTQSASTALWYAGIMLLCIVMSLLNYLIFFLSTRNLSRYTPHEVHRRQQFRAQMREPRPGSGIAKHKCAVCGRTELDDPNLQFRFCSKCEGNYEYCQDHLFTHQHIRRV